VNYKSITFLCNLILLSKDNILVTKGLVMEIKLHGFIS